MNDGIRIVLSWFCMNRGSLSRSCCPGGMLKRLSAICGPRLSEALGDDR